jgi:hypothetical protein
MSPDSIFAFANLLAMIGWAALALQPRRRWVVEVVVGRAIPIAFAATYALIVATQWVNSTGGFSSLPAVRQLFENPWLLLAGWIHYLAFDLLIGVWEVRDASERGIPHLAVIPCLALTFMFGPAGWLLYMSVRSSRLAPSG